MLSNKGTSPRKRDPGPISVSSRHIPFDFCSPTAKMDLLRAQLAARGHSTDGMSLRLLILEWKYDLLVLSIQLGNWMRDVDQRFSRLRN